MYQKLKYMYRRRCTYPFLPLSLPPPPALYVLPAAQRHVHHYSSSTSRIKVDVSTCCLLLYRLLLRLYDLIFKIFRRK